MEHGGNWRKTDFQTLSCRNTLEDHFVPSKSKRFQKFPTTAWQEKRDLVLGIYPSALEQRSAAPPDVPACAAVEHKKELG